MKYYLRPTGENRYEVGTEDWLEILDVNRVEGEYYELEVAAPSVNRYVCIDRDLPCPDLEFARESDIISHVEFLDECVIE